MKIRCVWEHNQNDSILYSVDYIGAYARGENLETALQKIPGEIGAYSAWSGAVTPEKTDAEDRQCAVYFGCMGAAEPEKKDIEIVQEKMSELQICDADSDVIFEEEQKPLTAEEYARLKTLALKSAADFLELYEAVPDKNKSALPPRKTFYGEIPRTAEEMYQHTKNVNNYYFGEIGIDVDNGGTILECRERGFARLEKTSDFLENKVLCGSYEEEWSLRKVLRRFIWHDRIHGKAMYRMALKTFGEGSVPDIFKF